MIVIYKRKEGWEHRKLKKTLPKNNGTVLQLMLKHMAP